MGILELRDGDVLCVPGLTLASATTLRQLLAKDPGVTVSVIAIEDAQGPIQVLRKAGDA